MKEKSTSFWRGWQCDRRGRGRSQQQQRRWHVSEPGRSYCHQLPCPTKTKSKGLRASHRNYSTTFNVSLSESYDILSGTTEVTVKLHFGVFYKSTTAGNNSFVEHATDFTFLRFLGETLSYEKIMWHPRHLCTSSIDLTAFVSSHVMLFCNMADKKIYVSFENCVQH